MTARAKRVGYHLDGGWIAIALAPDNAGEERPDHPPPKWR